jgi:hypothetical protein
MNGPQALFNALTDAGPDTRCCATVHEGVTWNDPLCVPLN